MRMVRAHEAVVYIKNNTNLADEVYVTSEGDRSAALHGTRKRKDGSTQEIRIEVQDSGPGAGDLRYAVSVYPEGGEPIIANEAGSLTEAISNADAHSSGLG